MYAALAEKGYFPKEELQQLRKTGHFLQGHPDMKKVPGVDMSTGSLGQGISAAAGMALAGKIDNKTYRVYCLLGDGEAEEGIVWEAAMAAAHYRLDNLLVILDHNGLQIDGSVQEVMNSAPLADKWRAFGWNVIEADGHDIEELTASMQVARNCRESPQLLLRKRSKARGFPLWKIKWAGMAMRQVPNRPRRPLPSWKVVKAMADQIYDWKNIKKIATRDAYGQALVQLGKENKDIVVLDADLAKSTKTSDFAKAFPGRFFDMGIAEQNLIGFSAGLAAAGKIPFASTFAVFGAGRAFEVIRNSVAYPKLNVKIAVTHAGISVGEDGGSHQAIEDLALMRALPQMTVIVPADAVETGRVIRAAAAYSGPVYIRMGRLAVPVLFDDNYKFVIGKANILRRAKTQRLLPMA